jgi:hypothetical protein
MLSERRENYEQIDEQALMLSDAKIDIITARSKSCLSNYVDVGACELYVENESLKLVPLQKYSQIFSRYQNPAEFVRIFVDRKDLIKAQKIIGL